MRLEDSLQFVRGVGPRRAEQLASAGFRTVEDLVLHLPFRYEDRRRILSTAAAEPGVEAAFMGRITGIREQRTRGRRVSSVLHAILTDDAGWLNLVWFHQAAFFKKKLESAESWLVYGKVEAARRGGLEIVHPDVEPYTVRGDPAGQGRGENAARILPVYQKPGGLSVHAMRHIVGGAVAGAAAAVQSIVPAAVRTRAGLTDVTAALAFVHEPPVDADVDSLNAFESRHHRTLIFEELFALQIGMVLRKEERKRTAGIAMPRADGRIAAYLERLPFEPTGAQRRVIGEIADDMAASQPMNRLVQGDVGSGKTVVAFAAALQAAAAGRQAALMAPTELLAEQHANTMRPWAGQEKLQLALLSGNLPAAEACRVRSAVAAGEVDIVVGTHALVQESTEFARLGLAIVDEQHRFGVMQRAALKGSDADTLLLSATPIPRTLSLVLFGDVDVSLLDELPPGRKPVTTRVIRASARERLHERMAAAMKRGSQCYIVYPLVEESEAMDLADATSMAEELRKTSFHGFSVGLLHGRMKSVEKDAVMRSFRAGEIDCLVATTVIEVGIDVPNATIMVIEHPERFGLAQLHQLRGRVGRGQEESFCCLVADRSLGPDSYERLRILESTPDGFDVAEADLKLRGPGEYLGTRQAGAPAFRAANLVRDAALLEQARDEAAKWLYKDPRLERDESRALRSAIERRFGDKLDLAAVG